MKSKNLIFLGICESWKGAPSCLQRESFIRENIAESRAISWNITHFPGGLALLPPLQHKT